MTRSPRPSSLLATWKPMKPATPVTTTDICCCHLMVLTRLLLCHPATSMAFRSFTAWRREFAPAQLQVRFWQGTPARSVLCADHRWTIANRPALLAYTAVQREHPQAGR